MDKRKKCDVVLEGGITSGAVYPGFVCKLAEYYDFQSIGGTSAGGIAAALAAAAQYARNSGVANAFDAVAKVPAWLGSKSGQDDRSNLFALFQPSAETASLYRLATSALDPGLAPKLKACFSVLWIEFLLAFVPGAMLTYFVWGHPIWKSIALILLLVVPGVVCSLIVSLLGGVLVRVGRLCKHNYGLCTGYSAKASGKPLTLVAWLNDQINEIAGKDAKEPLTFGDLKNKGITLRMMTTCFTWGRPFTMPFDSNVFYFCPKTFRDYFPEEVVQWMEKHPAVSERPPHDLIALEGYCPMPDADNLPVIVATRMSLSFPILFCAVPLAAVDFTLRRRKVGESDPASDVPGGSIGNNQPRVPELVWFTDGGICNNFPIHLFDGPIPLWPTFGIELTQVRPDRPTGESRAWLPNSNNSAIQPDFKRFAGKKGLLGEIRQLGAVAAAIIDSARNWVNNLQSVVPGYRDRIVRVSLTSDEGGLNLNMSTELVTDLSKYGSNAAQKLIDHFIHGLDNNVPTAMTWENQRWVRYRSTMSLLESFLTRFTTAIQNPEPDDPAYSVMIANGANRTGARGYPFSLAQIPIANSETNALVAIGESMSNTALSDGTPRPEPVLVARPDF